KGNDRFFLAPTMILVTSLFGARPFFCNIICDIRSLEPPRKEMPTIFPLRSWTDLIWGWDINSNGGLDEERNTSLTGRPRTAAAIVDPEDDVYSTERRSRTLSKTVCLYRTLGEASSSPPFAFGAAHILILSSSADELDGSLTALLQFATDSHSERRFCH